MTVFLLAALLVFAFAMAAEATVGSKQVKIDYNNFKIIVDGKSVNLLDREPFAIEGTIYLPLRVVGEALSSTVNWQNETKTVSITSGSTAEVTSLKLQLTSKDQEIANLKKQVADLQGQSAKGGNLSELEDDLIDDYDEIGDVPIEDIILDGDEDEVDVEIEVNLRRYDDEWADLSDSKIRSWLVSLVGDIQKELTKNTEVTGEIVDIDSGDTLVKFSKDGTKSFSIQYKDDDYRGGSSTSDVADDLEGDSFYVDDIEFVVDSVSYSSSDIITVRMNAEDSDAKARWNALDDDEIESDVEDICEEIADIFADEANADPELVKINFRDENGSSLGSYDYDVYYGSLD